MKTLSSLLGASALIAACSGAPAGAPSVTPGSDLPTLAPPIATAPAPTEPPAPTDAPDASPGGVGDRIEVSGYQYLRLVEAEYTAEGYSDVFKPAEGNVIYAFLFEFEGLDPEGSSFNPLYFDLTVDGTDYNTAVLGSKEPALGSGDLQPGDTAEGWVSFEAPLADEIVLKYEPVMGLAGNAVEWVVEVIQ